MTNYLAVCWPFHSGQAETHLILNDISLLKSNELVGPRIEMAYVKSPELVSRIFPEDRTLAEKFQTATAQYGKGYFVSRAKVLQPDILSQILPNFKVWPGFQASYIFYYNSERPLPKIKPIRQ